MQRIGRNTLLEFESATKILAKKTNIKSIPEKGISAAVLSAYLSPINPANPGKNRCIFLEQVSKYCGYDFTASDWMFSRDQIREALVSERAA